VSQDRVSRHQIETRVARVLTFDVAGHPGGWPVFLLHGSPGSRIGPKPRGSVLYRLGIQLISYDRPGYGGSTPKPKRSVADAAYDIEDIAADLGLDRFAVVGRSGGGPHALAAAAPRQVPAVVVHPMCGVRAGRTGEREQTVSGGVTERLVAFAGTGLARGAAGSLDRLAGDHADGLAVEDHGNRCDRHSSEVSFQLASGGVEGRGVGDVDLVRRERLLPDHERL
jgi:pimeloyl-ACP methyl ester carboxylesterase